MLAAIAAVLATVALCVPLAYQAHSAREDGPDTAPPATTTSTAVPTSAPPTTGPTVPAHVLGDTHDRDPLLTWTATTDDPAPQPLDGATLNGVVVVELAAGPATTSVRAAEFWLDHFEPGTPPHRIDEVAPFTLDDDPTDAPGTIDTRKLEDGPHVAVVVAHHDDGSTGESSSLFHVDNG